MVARRPGYMNCIWKDTQASPQTTLALPTPTGLTIAPQKDPIGCPGSSESAFLLFYTRLPAVVRGYSELGHLGTWVGTKRVGLPDPRLGVEQAWLGHHHGAHLRRLEDEKHHREWTLQRSALPSSVPADLPWRTPSCPSAWLQGRQRQMEPEEVKQKKKKSFLLENQDIVSVFQKPRWSGTKLSERFFHLLLLTRVERKILKF